MSNDLPVIRGSFVHWLPVKGRAVLQLQIEVPTEHGHRIMDILGFPQPGTEIPVAIARLTAEAALRDVNNGGEDSPAAADPHPTDSDAAPAAAAPARRRWSELSRAQRAGMRCAEAEFCRWLWAKNGLKWEDAMGDAAEAVRILCNVVSRTEFDTNADAAARWDALEARFLQATGRMAVDR